MNSRKKFWLFVIFLIISIIIASLSGVYGLNERFVDYLFSFNENLAGLIYTSLFIILTSFSFSVSVMTSLGVLFFPFYKILFYAMIGILGSSIIDFYIARKLGKDYVKRYIDKKGGRIENFEEVIEKNNFKTIFILSAIFFIPPTIPNFLGGVMKINLKGYFIATFLGNLPNTFFTILLIRGILDLNEFYVYISIISLFLISLIALFFYKGEIRELVKISFPNINRFL
jgi:uncharacterized membrane protein YdjX (TVP38/TMEM64 family)